MRWLHWSADAMVGAKGYASSAWRLAVEHTGGRGGPRGCGFAGKTRAAETKAGANTVVLALDGWAGSTGGAGVFPAHPPIGAAARGVVLFLVPGMGRGETT